MIARPINVGAGAVLMLMAGSAGAVGLSNVLTNNNNIGYWSLPPGTCILEPSLADPGEAARTAIVQGTNTPCIAPFEPGPGGNIELGFKDGWSNGRSEMTGFLAPFGPLKLSSLLSEDWNTLVAPGVTLAEQYISEAIEANCGESPSPPLLAASVKCFLSGAAADCGGLTISPSPAERASDPNVFYGNSEGSDLYARVTIGLAGSLNASDLLPPRFTCPSGATPLQLQLSEVVKFDADWVDGPQYLYSFTASPSGVVTNDATESYDAIYEVEPVIPTPAPAPAISALGLSALSGLLALVGAWRTRGRRARRG